MHIFAFFISVVAVDRRVCDHRTGSDYGQSGLVQFDAEAYVHEASLLWAEDTRRAARLRQRQRRYSRGDEDCCGVEEDPVKTIKNLRNFWTIMIFEF